VARLLLSVANVQLLCINISEVSLQAYFEITTEVVTNHVSGTTETAKM
jgi:hypothetical protein